ncbi:MAG TPA: arginine deiminase-related protein [Thermoanaerobaculia bacterium]|nr:arginine deiminase-related protein [Thermoanaerobaculia bacterium]
MLFHGSALRDPDSLRTFLSAAAPRPAFRRILMVDPAHFQVRHVLNPHMEGMIGLVDADAARAEWEAIRRTYESLGYDVTVVDGMDDHPDVVFAANQLLPYVDASGRPSFVLSHMAKVERQGEVPYLADALRPLGFQTHGLRTRLPLEGTGDAIWHPNRNLIWGGHGFRTDESAWEEVSEVTGARVVPLSLVDDRMYHLDVALMAIDEQTAFSFRGAFDEESWARLEAGFTRLVEVDEQEAVRGFALNGHCPDGRNLLLPAGNPLTRAKAEELGLTVYELPTREFQKAGGSIFCLKNVMP